MSDETTEAGPENASPVKRLLRPVRGRLAMAVGLAALGQVLVLVPLAGIALIAKSALRDGAGGASGGIGEIVAVSLACLLAGMALMTIGELLAHLADNWLTVRLRRSMAERLSQVPLGWFSDNASGKVRHALQDDVATLHELTAHYYTTRGRCVGAMAASVVYLLAMDWRLAVLSLLPFPLFHLIFGAAKKSISEERLRDFIAGQNRIGNAVVEFIDGIPVVKAFGATGRAHAAYREAVDGFQRAFLRFTGPLVAPLANANAVIAPVTVLAVALASGALFVRLGWIEAVDVLPFVLVAPGISGPMVLLGFLGHAVANATGAAERISALLETPLLEQPGPDAAEEPGGAEIRFEAVRYAYAGKGDAVHDIGFALEPGTVTAIVGPSGAGKSTIARLLLRFFDPDGGKITLGGADLRRMALPALYRRVGFVLQDVRLIHASLHDNIALGRPSSSRQEVEAAARAAGIHDRIAALPRGYDTIVGRQARLSGGEEQRVGIARAVLLDPPVLVLDEATAAADAETEAAVQDALSRFARGRTLLVIAHRLDTIMHADRIIVMERGRIVETGDHAALLARGGCYARLWRAGAYGDRDVPQAAGLEVQP